VKDGETQILAGLIQQDERNSAQRVPFLGDFPVLGRLFSSTSENGVKTEIVLLITPRIIRNIPLPVSGKSEIFSGTQNALGATPIQLRALSNSGANNNDNLPSAPLNNSPQNESEISIQTPPVVEQTQPEPLNNEQDIFLPPMPGVAQ
jgi:general secretion pathway protein D